MQDSPHNAFNDQAAGMLGASSASGRKPGEIPNAMQPMRQSYERMDSLVRQLNDIADRLGGDRPPNQPPGSDVEASISRGDVLSEIHVMCQNYNGLVGRLDNAVNRLEELV